MKKYITVAALLAAGTAFANAGVTHNYITFVDAVAGTGLHDQSPATTNFYVNTTTFGNGNACTMQGLYVTSTGGVKMNAASSDVNVKYLYLDENVVINPGSSATTAGELTWSSGNAHTSLNIQDGGWVDINADYSARVSLKNLTSYGSAVYLNENGALSLTDNGSAYTLNNNVAVYADIDAESDRTFLLGDFSNWEGMLSLMIDADNYIVYSGKETTIVGDLLKGSSVVADSTSLRFVSAAVPEPSAFGLLAGIGALALVASRRRRK